VESGESFLDGSTVLSLEELESTISETQLVVKCILSYGLESK
jgi:hypothetical protein